MTPTPQPASSAASSPAIDTREIITLCRQMGNMMEAGVDILRITRVLRSQTENTHLLEFYDAFDHDLRLGRSVADAMANAPELFSPFAVSLVQEGEERNDIAGSLFKIADFLQSEASIGEWAETVAVPETIAGSGSTVAVRHTALNRRAVSLADSAIFQEGLDRLFDRTIQTLSILLLVESGIAAAVAGGLVPSQWWSALSLLAAAIVLATIRSFKRIPKRDLASQDVPSQPAIPDAVSNPPAPASESQGQPERIQTTTKPVVAPTAAEPPSPPKAGEAKAEAEETKVVWPTAEEENAAYSKVWQRSAPQEEQYD